MYMTSGRLNIQVKRALHGHNFCRLDYWLISDSLCDMLGNVDVMPAIKTDHSAIILQLHKIEEGVEGPGFWKMNTSILHDAACIDEVKKKVST